MVQGSTFYDNFSRVGRFLFKPVYGFLTKIKRLVPTGNSPDCTWAPGGNSNFKHAAKCKSVLWIRIRIGSVFRSFLDPDPYSKYVSGSTHANTGTVWDKIEAKDVRFKILINNSETQLI